MNRCRARTTGGALALALAGCGAGGTPARGPAPAPGSPGALQITSPGLSAGARLPARYTCDGADVSPRLDFTGVGRGVAELALVLVDTDARDGAGPFVHWVVFGIAPDVRVAPSNELPPGAQQAATSFGRARYLGPCPPPGRAHHYRFELLAQRARLRLTAGLPAAQALQAIRAGTIASAGLPVSYAR